MSGGWSKQSCRELSNAYLLAKIGFDTAENEPCKVCRIAELALSGRLRWPSLIRLAARQHPEGLRDKGGDLADQPMPWPVPPIVESV